MSCQHDMVVRRFQTNTIMGVVSKFLIFLKPSNNGQRERFNEARQFCRIIHSLSNVGYGCGDFRRNYQKINTEKSIMDGQTQSVKKNSKITMNQLIKMSAALYQAKNTKKRNQTKNRFINKTVQWFNQNPFSVFLTSKKLTVNMTAQQMKVTY